MSVSLTRILANAGIPIAMNALVPGSGMADMFVRNAGTGIARGLVNSPSGPQRVGGRGAPEGAMPTRKFGSTRESVGELKSGFKDWLVDPLQAKKEKREQARDTALAVRLGITGGEYSLTHRPAMSLIKKRSGDVQTNIMILQFRVQQFMARNLSAIASTLGVQKSKIGHEDPDPSRSWFGNLLSSIHKDLQENKVFSTLETIGKHAINIGQILNPFTLGSRAGKAAKSFGEFMQRLALGKEGYEMMKDPTKLYEKAGLKQDFQTKSINLMKINNEYQRHQLDMLFNLVGIGQRLLGFLGIDYKITKTGLAHDEFDGALKTERQVAEAKAFREETLESTQRIAARRSIIGRIAPITSVISGAYQKIQSAVNVKKANKRDKDILSAVYKSGPDKITGITDELDDFYYRLNPTQIDWHAGANQDIADDFKEKVINAMTTRNPKDRKRQRALIQAWETGGRIADAKNLTRTAYNSTRRVSNWFTSLTGGTSPDIEKGEARDKYAAYLRYGGDFGMAGINAGSINEKLLRESYESSLARRIMRAIPIFGIGAGIRQQREIAGAEVEFEEKLRNPIAQADTDEMLRYGKHAGRVRKSKRGKSNGFGIFVNSTAILDNISDNAVKKLTNPIYKSNIVDIDTAALDKIKQTDFNVKLVGIGGNVVQDAQPLFTSFFAGLKGVADYLVNLMFNHLPIRGSNKKPIEVYQTAEKGGIFSGSDISDLENQIITQPTLFQYDDIHQFAKGGAVDGRGRKAKRWGASGRGKRTGLVGEGKKDNKKYNPEAIMPLAEDKDGNLGVKNAEKKKAIDDDDNTKTQAERDKEREKKEEKIEEEKKEEKHQENEDDKKGLLQKIVDLLDPNSKINKLRDKIKKKLGEGGFNLGSIFGSISDLIPGFLKTLGAGILGAGLLKLLPDGGKEIIKSIFGFAWDSLKYVGGIVWDLLKEHGPGLAKDAWEAFKEHPLIGAGLITTMFPGTVGMLISKIGIPIIKRFPLATPLVLGFGAMAYNLYDSFSNSKDENGSFSFGKFVSEFFIGSGDGIGNIIGKAGTYGLIGAKIGAMFGGVGAIPGFIAGAAIGSIIGGTKSTDEKGKFNFGVFLKNFFTGNNAKGGVENARSNALKWGFIGAAIGLPFGGIMAIPGFLAGAGLGAILGGIGSEKLGEAWEKYKTGETVAKFMGWKSDSYAYYMANTPMANIVPFVGPFIWGMCGKLLDLGKTLFDKIKDYLTPDWMKSEEDPDVKKSQEQANAKRTATFTYQHDVYDPNTGEATKENKTIKITKKQEAYINSGKDENEKRQRAVEVEQENRNEDNWRRQSAGKTKYDTDKYIELQKKWAKENEERMHLRSYKIDIPATNFSGKEDVFGVINDFNTTKENAEQYNQLIKDNKVDDAIRFAKGIKAQHDEEDNKRKADRDAELKKIEIKDANKKGVGSSPDDLKMDACRKASCSIAAMTAQRGIGGPKEDAYANANGGKIQYHQWGEKVKTPTDYEQANPDNPVKLSKWGENPANTQSQSPSSVPAAAEASGLTTSPPQPDATQPVQTSGNSGSGTQLNWLEKIISQTIQGAFKVGGFIADVAQKGANVAQQGFGGGGLGGSSAPSGDPRLDDIGWLSSSRESKGDRSLVAYDKDGGTSYGKYQFASKRGSESMVDFLRWAAKTQGEQGKKLHDFMAQSVGGDLYKLNTGSKTGAPVDAWKKAVADGLVGDMDEKYMRYRFHDKALNNLSPDVQKLVNSSRTLSQVLVSTAVQHGENKAQGKGAPWVFEHAYKPGISVEEFIKNVYEERKRAYHGQYQRSVYNRYDEEVQQALALYGVEKKIAAGGGSMAVTGGGASGPIPNASPAVQKYLSIMASHVPAKYYMHNPERMQPGTYDCSSFVGRNLKEAGYNINPASTTVTLYDSLPKLGFKFYPLPMDYGLKTAPAQLQPGDILLNNKGAGPRHGIPTRSNWRDHVETYWGNNKMIGAHYKDAGTTLTDFRSSGWPGFWRLTSGTGSGPDDFSQTGSMPQTSGVSPDYFNKNADVSDLMKTSSVGKLVWPTLSSVINSHFGKRDPNSFGNVKGAISANHGGTDIHATLGTPVYSAMDGDVTGTSRINSGTIGIRHGDDLETKYVHLSRSFVHDGDKVKAGDLIGSAGGTGKGGDMSAYTPHLHFEMLKNGVRIDPEKFFAANANKVSKPQISDTTKKDPSDPGVGGPDFTPRINKQMNEYLSNRGVGGPEESSKSDNRIIAELKKLQVIMLGVMKSAGKPAIAVAAPSSSGNEDPQKKVTEAGGMDSMADSVFSQIGGLLPNLNISLTGLGTSIS